MTKDLAKNQSELIKFVLSYYLHVSYLNNESGLIAQSLLVKRSENYVHI